MSMAGPCSAVDNSSYSRVSSQMQNPVWPLTFVSPIADSRKILDSSWRKYVHLRLVNRLEGLSLLRKCVIS